MSKQLDELLFLIRQHPAFPELMTKIEPPGLKAYREGTEPQQAFADHLYRSGRRLQHELWRQFLTGEPTSQQEKP